MDRKYIVAAVFLLSSFATTHVKAERWITVSRSDQSRVTIPRTTYTAISNLGSFLDDDGVLDSERESRVFNTAAFDACLIHLKRLSGKGFSEEDEDSFDDVMSNLNKIDQVQSVQIFCSDTPQPLTLPHAPIEIFCQTILTSESVEQEITLGCTAEQLTKNLGLIYLLYFESQCSVRKENLEADQTDQIDFSSVYDELTQIFNTEES